MKKWKVISTNKKLSTGDEIFNELLKIRKIEDPKSFFNSSLEDLNLSKLKIDRREIKKAVERINDAVLKNEKIIVLGDYDVDGICASAIVWETIYSKYKNVFPYIPDRFSEGYGISAKSLENLLEKHPDVKLIITVDNGITANDSIDSITSKGVDVIVTDHHVAGQKMPKAFAVVHTTELCGAGVAWILARELSYLKDDEVLEKIELAALATVTDLVPLIGPSRSILKLGLNHLHETKRPGLRQLALVSGIETKKIGVYEIGHLIGPRLNASGRVDHAIQSLRLLCSRNLEFARKTAFDLDMNNKKRQQMVASAYEHASLTVSLAESKKNFIAVHHESYSEGIIGLIASKLTEKFYRPSIAISVKADISKGSARSIKGVNIVEILNKSRDLLEGAGGHPMAAGFSVKTEKIEILYEKLNKEFEKIPKEMYEKEISIDMEIGLNAVNEKVYEKIREFSPFGIGNPEPIFMIKNLKVLEIRKLGSEGKHLKMKLGKGEKVVDAIGFNMNDFEIQKNMKIDAAFSIDLNEWNGKRDIQLKLKDIRF